MNRLHKVLSLQKKINCVKNDYNRDARKFRFFLSLVYVYYVKLVIRLLKLQLYATYCYSYYQFYVTRYE